MIFSSIKVNDIYSLKFKPGFVQLDKIYRVLSIMSYSDILENGIDIEELYSKYDQSVIFDQDISKLNSSRFLKLEDITNKDNVIHVPEYLIKEEPVFTLIACKRLGISLDLGVWDNVSHIEHLKTEISDVVKSLTGVVNIPTIYTINDLVMEDGEYKIVEGARKSIQDHIETSYNKINDLKKDVARYKNMVDTLTSIIEEQKIKIEELKNS